MNIRISDSVAQALDAVAARYQISRNQAASLFLEQQIGPFHANDVDEYVLEQKPVRLAKLVQPRSTDIAHLAAPMPLPSSPPVVIPPVKGATVKALLPALTWTTTVLRGLRVRSIPPGQPLSGTLEARFESELLLPPTPLEDLAHPTHLRPLALHPRLQGGGSHVQLTLHDLHTPVVIEGIVEILDGDGEMDREWSSRLGVPVLPTNPRLRIASHAPAHRRTLIRLPLALEVRLSSLGRREGLAQPIEEAPPTLLAPLDPGTTVRMRSRPCPWGLFRLLGVQVRALPSTTPVMLESLQIGGGANLLLVDDGEEIHARTQAHGTAFFALRANPVLMSPNALYATLRPLGPDPHPGVAIDAILEVMKVVSEAVPASSPPPAPVATDPLDGVFSADAMREALALSPDASVETSGAVLVDPVTRLPDPPPGSPLAFAMQQKADLDRLNANRRTFDVVLGEDGFRPEASAFTDAKGWTATTTIPLGGRCALHEIDDQMILPPDRDRILVTRLSVDGVSLLVNSPVPMSAVLPWVTPVSTVLPWVTPVVGEELVIEVQGVEATRRPLILRITTETPSAVRADPKVPEWAGMEDFGGQDLP